MKAVVHMGLPKTGTTSIQSWLRVNADALRARGVGYDRINYPGLKWRQAHVEIGICQMAEAGIPHPHAQTKRFYKLTDLAAQQGVADRYLSEFQRVIRKSGAQHWIFSCEDLGSLTKTPELAQALDQWTKRTFDEVHYVVYIRRQEDWLLSRYSQVLRHGDTRTLEDFINSGMTQNLMRVPRALRKGIGRDSVTVRLLERDAMVDGDLIADFAQACGIDHSGLAVPKRKNEAFSVAAAEFLRQANMRWPVSEPAFKRPTPILGNLENILTNRYSGDRKMQLTQSQIDAIRAANSETNERVRKAFFPDREELFPAKAPVSDDLRQNRATADEIAAIGLDLFRDARIGALDTIKKDEINQLKTTEEALGSGAEFETEPARARFGKGQAS